MDLKLCNLLHKHGYSYRVGEVPNFGSLYSAVWVSLLPAFKLDTLRKRLIRAGYRYSFMKVAMQGVVGIVALKELKVKWKGDNK